MRVMRPKVGVLLHPLCFFFSYSVEIYVYFVLGHSCKGTRKTVKALCLRDLIRTFLHRWARKRRDEIDGD